MSIAFVIGGRGAYPCPEQMDMVPVGVVGFVLGVGGEMMNDVWEAVERAGDIAGENSPSVNTRQQSVDITELGDGFLSDKSTLYLQELDLLA